MTVHDCAAPDEAEEIRRYGPGLVDQLHHTPGFLSGLGVGFGEHFITISAWSDPASPHRFTIAGLHADAVGRVTNDRFTASGMHSLWLPHRLRRLLRCPNCHNLADTEKPARRRSRSDDALPQPGNGWSWTGTHQFGRHARGLLRLRLAEHLRVQDAGEDFHAVHDARSRPAEVRRCIDRPHVTVAHRRQLQPAGRQPCLR